MAEPLITESPKRSSDDTEASLQRDQAETVTRWLREIKSAETHEAKWRTRASKIIDLYKDERKDSEDVATSSNRFNLLYSNTEVLRGALYSRCPTPDVRRSHLDRDPVGRVAAIILQRALVSMNKRQVDGEDFDSVLKDSVFDMVLPGRAIARVKYAPQIEGEEVTAESADVRYIEWEQFRISPAKRWSKVRWVAWAELLTRDDLIEQFGDEIGKAVEMHWMPPGTDDTEENQILKRACVWVIWNKSDRKVYVVCDGYKKSPLKVMDDPLRLEQFFPCPRPLYSICTTNSLVPVPEYTTYQDHAIQLDDLNERIAVLTDALRRRGVYDASIAELADLATAGDNKFVPVKDYAQFATKGGLAKSFEEIDISGLALVLKELMLQAEAKKAQIYEICGISDIMRGVVDPNEKLGQSEMKSQYGSIRVQPRQAEVQRFARDLMRIQAEIIAEHFSAKSLAQMTGVSLAMDDQEKQMIGMTDPQDERLTRPTWDQVMQVLRSDKLRGFAVDIETDSTMKPRAEVEQKQRTELLTSMTGFMAQALPAVASGMVPKDVFGKVLMFGVRAFPASADLEETLDKWIFGDALGQQGGLQPQAQQPDPAQVAEQEAQVKEQQLTAERQAFDSKRLELEAGKAQMAANDAQAAREQAERQHAEALRHAEQLARDKMDHDRMMHEAKMADAQHARMNDGRAEMQAGTSALSEAKEAIGGLMEQLGPQAEAVNALAQAILQQGQALQSLAAAVAAPRENVLVRDVNGRAAKSISRTMQ